MSHKYPGEIMKLIAELESEPCSAGLGLRLDLSQIIHCHLSETGLTQNEFSKKCGMRSQELNRIIHSRTNVTFETAGNILFAMGLRGKISVEGKR